MLSVKDQLNTNAKNARSIFTTILRIRLVQQLVRKGFIKTRRGSVWRAMKVVQLVILRQCAQNVFRVNF